MTVQWYGEEQKRVIDREMSFRIRTITKMVKAEARRLLFVAGTGKHTRKYNYTVKGEQRSKSKGTKIYGKVRSLPGEPPRKQTGLLRASVATEVFGLRGRIGTNLKYGKHLELGTRKMQARPWLRRSAEDIRDALLAILRKPIN